MKWGNCMEIEIGKKTYELKFGLSFIEAIDNIYTQEMSGVSFSMGLEMMSTYMGLRRPTALQNVIISGTSHLNSKPSRSSIETYLEELFSEGNQEEMFKQVEVEMEQAPFLKQTMKNLKQDQQKQAKKPTKK